MSQLESKATKAEARPPAAQVSRGDPAAEHHLIEAADRVLAPTYVRPARMFVRGSGVWLEDQAGARFLDLTAGIAVVALGHGSAVVAEALREAADGLVHVSNLFHTAPAVELAEELVRRSFADRVFFCNSGAEAAEGAIKFARLVGGAQRRGIVYFDGSFHGRTLGALAATDRPDYQRPFAPLPQGFTRAAWNAEAGLEAIDRATAAAIVEPIQGESGIRVPDSSWLRALRRRCDEVGALLVFDEVQCGLGRTGSLWAHEGFGVTPDIMTLAKPLAGGLPMGAVLMNHRVAEAVVPGSHATTFGGGPLVAHVALKVLRTIATPDFLAAVRRRGELLVAALGQLPSPLIREVRGVGLMAGLQLTVPPPRVAAAALAEGLLVAGAGDNVLRLVPALTITDDELAEGVARLGRALDRVAQEVQS